MLFAAALSLICRLPSASVLTGQDAVTANLASMRPVVSASQAPVALWVNMSVMMPFRLQHPAAFGEDRGHALPVVPAGESAGALLTLEPGGIGDGFAVLVGEPAAKQFREDPPGGAFQPHIEEVRKLRIHHIVVIGRVDHDDIDAAVLDMVEVVAGLAGDCYRRWRWPIS